MRTRGTPKGEATTNAAAAFPAPFDRGAHLRIGGQQGRGAPVTLHPHPRPIENPTSNRRTVGGAE